MPPVLDRGVAVLLLGVHAGLGVWAAVGFAELARPDVPWTRVSNPLFTDRMLLLQWSLIATAAAVFLVGYAGRWRGLPAAMLIVYGAMALVCAYQTFAILESPSRFRAMAVEYLEYAVILLYLFSSPHVRSRLG
jgi:hypothetical protein